MIASVLSLSSCDNSVVFEDNVKLPENRWEQKNAIQFTVDIQDTINPHNLYINLRNAGGYQFSNIFLFFTTTSPSGKMERDTLELTLADASGKWLGDGMGDISAICMLVDFKITPSELTAIFRNEDDSRYKACGDQLLRNFLNGLVIYKRGPRPENKH